MIKYMNNLLWKFMNTYVNIRNKWKLVEKFRWYTYKITCCQLLTILDYKKWYQIKVMIQQFDQKD